MTQIKGIDVSWHNGAIDWAKVKADGVKFVFIKATQGTTYSQVDYFKTNAPKALAAGLNVGAYHYGTFSNVSEAVAEAHYFLSIVKGVKLNYPIVLDLEENKDGASKKQLTDAAIAFLDTLKGAGYTALFYTSKGLLDTVLDVSRIKYPLWIARYYKELGLTADIWQYSDKGKVAGIGGCVDMNWGYRDFAPKPVVKAVAKPKFPGIIKVGSKGINVKSVQAKVGVKADGDFGPKTEAAVKAWQKKHGLSSDGIIGPKSWAKMF
jgi:lysozyme